jgi:hypothetical protein
MRHGKFLPTGLPNRAVLNMVQASFAAPRAGWVTGELLLDLMTLKCLVKA